MGIQENVRRREAKLAAQAQAEMQATHEEQPQAAPSESKVQPMFDTSALRQSIRAEVREVVHAELQASRPEPFDTEALRQVVRTELHAVLARQAMQTEQPAVDIEMLREVIRAELQAVPLVPAPVDMQAMQTMIRTEVCDIHTALQLLIEVIQAQMHVALCRDDESQGESAEQDELLPTALSPTTDDGEERVFPAQESEDGDALVCIEQEHPVVQSLPRPESPIRRLQRPGPVGLDLGWGGPTL